MKLKGLALVVLSAVLLLLPSQKAQTVSNTRFWMKIKAANKFERSVIATRVSIDIASDDYVISTGNLDDRNYFESKGWLIAATPITMDKDFPNADAAFHNYAEVKAELEKLVNENPSLVKMINLGKTYEQRDILGIQISGNLANADKMPAVFFVGGHHAREHLSVEVPIHLAIYLLDQYKLGNKRIVDLINSRDIQIVPAMNVDGLEFDIANGKYQYWRKNRRKNADGTNGVDLNRNYGYEWGLEGASDSGYSEVYHGKAPFSEPETLAVKNWIDSHQNISTILSFHTYSELILWPWGHKYQEISEERDRKVFEKMGNTMAKWNGYTPEQSSALYTASGDLTDWAYGAHKIIAFTFELDPSSGGMSGFYPGAAVIPGVVKKNLEPCLYLLQYADNPYRVLDESRTGSLQVGF